MLLCITTSERSAKNIIDLTLRRNIQGMFVVWQTDMLQISWVWYADSVK